MPHCLIGAYALAVRGYPRYTADVDLLTTDRRVLDPEFWSGLASPEIRAGDAFDPLWGVVRWDGEPAVDLIVGGGYAAEVAVQTAVSETMPVPVATSEALVLLKLEAAGRFDLDDVCRLIEVRARLGDDALPARVAGDVAKLSERAQRAWAEVLRRQP